MEIRFIKLGDGGKWEKSCIEEDNTIRLGYESPFHYECVNKEWEPVKNYWLAARKNNEGAASRDIRQIRDFYELSDTDIWITFYKRKMYWCRATMDVQELNDGSRIRKVIDSWSCCDKTGTPLTIENIDGRITKVQGFRGTICGVEIPTYLIRKINGEALPEVEVAKESLNKLQNDVEELIKGLWWKDFELLIDLIFSKLGWQRVSVLGATEKDIDLDVYSPVSLRRAFVQVKTATDSGQISSYFEKYNTYDQFQEMYFVFHTLTGIIAERITDDPNVHLWDLKRVSELVINAGLINWLITKRT